MGALTLYGTARSRAARCLLAAEELGVAYKHVPIKPGPDSPDRKLLESINPNRRVPVLVDDGVALWESMAINLYLGNKFTGQLWPTKAADLGRLYQWSVWVMTEVDRPDWQADRRSEDPTRRRRAKAGMRRALHILDDALSTSPFLLGARFSLADVNVAGALTQPGLPGHILWQAFDLEAAGLSHLQRWLDACFRRSAWRKVAELD